MNRLVGRHRKWLPPEEARVSEAFWLQYEDAEKYDKEFRAEVDKLHKQNNPRANWWNHPLEKLDNRASENENFEAAKTVDDAMTAVLERHGINVDFQLEGGQQDLLMLKAA